jgi:hypothetical protein
LGGSGTRDEEELLCFIVIRGSDGTTGVGDEELVGADELGYKIQGSCAIGRGRGGGMVVKYFLPLVHSVVIVVMMMTGVGTIVG